MSPLEGRRRGVGESGVGLPITRTTRQFLGCHDGREVVEPECVDGRVDDGAKNPFDRPDRHRRASAPIGLEAAHRRVKRGCRRRPGHAMPGAGARPRFTADT